MAGEYVDNAELNLRFMEVLGVGTPGDGDDGGAVQFSVKELLVEQREELRRISTKIDERPTKEDLARLEVRLTAVELVTRTSEISLAKIGGVVAICGLAFGGIGTAIVLAVVGG